MGQVLPTLSAVDVPQCRHRPIPATTPAQRETPEDITDVGTQVWQTHAPPVAAALAFTNLATGTTGQLRCNGITYQVLGGAAPVTGADGQILFVKILSKVQVG
jgi:hypothetical protein